MKRGPRAWPRTGIAAITVILSFSSPDPTPLFTIRSAVALSWSAGGDIVRLKPGVDSTQTDPVLGLWLGVIARHHLEWTGVEMWVTSIRRKSSDWPTRHVVKPGELVTAADFRRWYLDELELAENFCLFLLARYKPWLKVGLEPDWLSERELEQRGGILNVDPHIHIGLRSVEWPTSVF